MWSWHRVELGNIVITQQRLTLVRSSLSAEPRSQDDAVILWKGPCGYSNHVAQAVDSNQKHGVTHVTQLLSSFSVHHSNEIYLFTYISILKVFYIANHRMHYAMTRSISKLIPIFPPSRWRQARATAHCKDQILILYDSARWTWGNCGDYVGGISWSAAYVAPSCNDYLFLDFV